MTSNESYNIGTISRFVIYTAINKWVCTMDEWGDLNKKALFKIIKKCVNKNWIKLWQEQKINIRQAGCYCITYGKQEKRGKTCHSKAETNH